MFIFRLLLSYSMPFASSSSLFRYLLFLHLHIMPTRPLQAAKRALVSLLLAFASQYGVALNLTRDSADKVVEQSYRKLLKRGAGHGTFLCLVFV